MIVATLNRIVRTSRPARGGRRPRWIATLGITAVSLAALTACGGDTDEGATGQSADPGTSAELGGVAEYDDLSRNHVEGTVAYTQNPPVGGDHSPVWINCGAYTDPVQPEMAVHALEHGAVWLAYDPALDAADLETLASVADGNGFVLVSPVAGIEAPVVATAWGLQLSLESVDDERLTQFVTSYAQGPQTPEPGAPCTGGMSS